MAGQILYDIIPPQTLTQYARTYDNEVLKPQAQFVLGMWMPDMMLDDLEYRIRRASLKDVDIAEYRAWDTPAKLTSRPGTSRISGEIGPISRGILLGEEERLRERTLLEGTNDPIIQAIYDDMERMVRSVRARIEMAIGDVINDGKVTITEGGLSLEADFVRSNWASPTVGTLWTDHTNAKPLSDLLDIQETYLLNNGIVPTELWMPRTRLKDLALNLELRQMAAANGTTPARLNAAQLGQVLADEGLPAFRIYDGNFRVDGTMTRVLPLNKVFLFPDQNEPLGNVFWGTTAEALVLQGKGLISRAESPGLIGLVLTQEHPVQTETLATCVALPVMPNPNLIVDMTVA